MDTNDRELLSRIEILERRENQGESLDAVTWIQVIVACLVIPALVLGWGWQR